MNYDLPYGYIEKLQDEISRFSNENSDLFIKNRLLQDEVNELKNKVIGYKNQILYKEKALAKVKADRDRIVHRVTKDKKRLIRRNTEFKAQIDKMKCCGNCRFSESDTLNGTFCHREGCFVVASGEKCKLWEN